jgi:RES domain
VLYAASERRAAFMETLSAFRPALRDLALVESLLPPGELDLPRSIGHVPAAYFTKRIAAFRLDRAQRWLDLRSPQTHASLRGALASELVKAGYSGSFNFGEIIGSDYAITQVISRWAYDAGYGGVAYPSTHDASLTGPSSTVPP